MSRTIRVSSGDRDYAYFRVVEKNGKDVTADTVVVGFGTYRATPTTVITPNGASDTVEHPTVSSIRVGLFIAADSSVDDGAHVIPPGNYYGWIKPTDAPSTAWVRCGPISVQ